MQEVTSKNAGMSKEGSDREPSSPGPLAFPISTASASKVSPTAVSSEPAEDLPPPNWELWRRRGACRIWKAVLISMAIKPVKEMRTRLRLEQEERYDEYVRRRKDLVALYGMHPEMPVVEHANQGQRPSEKYIKLSGLLALSKELGWDNIEAFENGMRATAAKSVAAAKVHASLENTPTVQRNALVRMGALLQLLEDVLKKGVQMNAATLLRGTTLNISVVASKVEKIVGRAIDEEKVVNFEKEANRKQFGEAKQALNTWF